MVDPAGGGPRRGRAFGLELHVAFDLPGLPPAPVDADEGRPRYGTFLGSGDGTHIACGPEDDEPSRWQRYLVAQVLPLFAVVHGFEVFHASVVALGGDAVVLVGVSRAGNSTIAAALLARVHASSSTTRSSSTPAMTYSAPVLRSVSRACATPHRAAPTRNGRWARPLVGADEDAMRYVVAEPVRLAALSFLHRPAPPGALLVQALDPVDPRRVLAASYNLLVRMPERCTRHLDVCARLASSVLAFRISIGERVDPVDVAAAVEARVTEGAFA